MLIIIMHFIILSCFLLGM